MYISIEQAIDVYNDLIDAKNNKADGHKGHDVDIYVHRLMPNVPTYRIHDENQGFDEENRMLEKKAAEDFHSLCYIFAKKHFVTIKINSIDLHEWISKIRAGEVRFAHRVNVEVKEIEY